MTTIYLAGRYTRREELLEHAVDLEEAGHEVTSRWLHGEHQWGGEAVEVARAYEAGENPPEAVRFAQDDVEDLTRAEIVVSFTETPRGDVLTQRDVYDAMLASAKVATHAGGRVLVKGTGTAALTAELNRRAAAKVSRGGRHVEFGMAVSAGKRLIVVGPRENVFHLLPGVEQFDTWPEALAALTQP